MKERPILFSAPMVRALLDGSKTQTRRPLYVPTKRGGCMDTRYAPPPVMSLPVGKCWAVSAWQHAKVGDRLWVREAWRWKCPDDPGDAMYRADGYTQSQLPPGFKWKPSIHMPRIASRITLEITGVRVERLNDIGEADAKTEGVQAVISKKIHGWTPHVLEYKLLWNQINGAIGPNSWRSNPWVWVVAFRVVA